MADRYWVGGANTWNATAGTKWALTSGGAGGQAVPTSVDDVYFDAASGAVAVVIGAGSTCKNLTFTGFTGSLGAGTSTLSCYGNLTMVPMTSAWTGTINFLSTTAQTITSNGFTFDNSLTFNGVGGSWQLVGNLTTGATRTATLINGALDLNNQTLSTGIFSSNNSNVRSIAFGTGNITLTGSGLTIYAVTTSTNLTTAGTPVVNATYAGSIGTRRLDVGTLSEFNAITYNITAGSDIIDWRTTNGTIKNLNFTGFTGSITGGGGSKFIYGDLTFGAGMTASTTLVIFNLAATSGTKTITTNNVTVDCDFTFSGVGGAWSFADALTQGSTRAFTITQGTVKLKSGVTSTVGSFVANSSSVKYLQSTTPGSQATISQASGTITVSDLTIQDSNAIGGASWTAYADYENVDAGNNDGWNFSLSPPYASYEPPIIIRSFTQPRRF